MICMLKVIPYLKNADVFENFRNMCFGIYELDPAKFLSAPGLACQPAFMKNQSNIRSFN